MKSTSLIAACAVSVLVMACDNVESTDVATDDMRLFMDVDVNADATAAVLVQLTTDNEALLEETFIDLAAGDRLLASIGDVTVAMTEEQIEPLGIYQYVTDFAGVAGGDTISIALERPRQVEAPSSAVVIPDPFDIDDPGTEFSRADGLTLTWSTDAVAENSRVNISGDCIDSITVGLPGDAAGVAIDPQDFVLAQGSLAGVECVLTVMVTLTNQGSVDPAYGRGGIARAHQTRSLELTTLP